MPQLDQETQKFFAMVKELNDQALCVQKELSGYGQLLPSLMAFIPYISSQHIPELRLGPALDI